MSDLYVCRSTGGIYESLVTLAVSWSGQAAMRVFRSVNSGVWFTSTAAEFDEQFDNYTPPQKDA